LLLPSWRLLLHLVWATWWGGIFFYAVVVVPIGTEAIGAVEQGFLTQQVSQMHNGLSILFLLCLLVEAIRSRSVGVGAIVATLALNLVLMFVWHSHLTHAMDFEKRAVPATFYNQHAVYLWLFAAQWIQGMLVPVLVLRSETVRGGGADLFKYLGNAKSS
jgi:hypothetical protein